MAGFIKFLCVLTLNSVLFWVLYAATSQGISPLKTEPASGDLQAVYLPLTAFGYVVHVVSTSLLFCMLNWQVSRPFRTGMVKHVGWRGVVKILATDDRFKWSYFLMFICVFVFANKIDWTIRLVFDDDRYGYYTTRPAAASLLMAVGFIGLIWVSLRQSNGNKAARRAALGCAVLSIACGVSAAYHVSRVIATVPAY